MIKPINSNINSIKTPPLAFKGAGRVVDELAIKRFRSPKNWINYFGVYEKGRGTTSFRYYAAMLHDLANGFFSNCKLRLIKDEKGNILAGYTYYFRKNKLGEKSMYIDSLARSKSSELGPKSKTLMPKIYEDVKNTALAKKVKELTLFVYAGDNKLRRKYESLGFAEDTKVFVQKLYLLRVRIENFYRQIN